MKKVLLVLCLLFASACTTAEYGLREAARPFVPPGVYEVWWREVFQDLEMYEDTTISSRSPADFAGIQFFEVGGDCIALGWLGDSVFRMCALGVWEPWSRHIFIARGLHLDEGLVKHELLHDILWMDIGAHNHPLFKRYCLQCL